MTSTTYPDGTTTYYTYNELGQLISEAYEGAVTTYRYDALGRRYETAGAYTTHTTYDSFDRPVYQESPIQNLTTTYDYEGRITSQTTPYGKTQTTYSLLGPITHTDSCGGVTETYYTLNPFITTETDPLGHTTKTLHDLCGRPINIERSSRLTTYTYDPCGRPTTESHNGYILAYTYDPCGRPLTLTENGERKTTYTYDQGRLVSLTKPSGITLTSSYDSYGRLKTYSGPDFCDHYTYDLMDRLLSVTSETGVTTRAYDPRGHLTSETLETGHTLSYSRDLYGRLLTFSLPNRAVHYTYEGPLVTSLTANSHTFDYAYDRLGHVTEIQNSLHTISTTYDPCGRPFTLSSPHFSQALTYDLAGNITQINTTDPLASQNHTYTYDPLDQLQSADGIPMSHDALGNRHPVDDQNQLLSHAYDPDGNPDYLYDSRDRLIEVSGERYTYDPFHRRLTKGTTQYLYSGDDLIGAISHDVLTQFRPLGPGLGAEIGSSPLFELGGECYFPIYDHRGSTAILLSSWGNVKEIYRYDPFGQVEILGAWGFSHASSFNPYQFLSKYADDTGLIYFGRRCRVGGGAYSKACLRPPLKLGVQFSRTQLSQDLALIAKR